LNDEGFLEKKFV